MDGYGMNWQKRPEDKNPQKPVCVPNILVSVVPGYIHWGTSKHPVNMDYPLPCYPAGGEIPGVLWEIKEGDAPIPE
jgi:hypothetical protein